jgi:hypothetical protein
MTTLNLAIVGLKLMAVYFLFEAALMLPEFAFMSEAVDTMNSHHSGPSTFARALVPVGCNILLGIGLFVAAPVLARKIVPNRKEEPAAIMSFDDIQSLLLAAAGLIILAHSFPGAISTFVDLITWCLTSSNSLTGPPGQPDFASMISTILRQSLSRDLGSIVAFLLGLFLVIRPQGFRNILHWMRTAGTGSNER